MYWSFTGTMDEGGLRELMLQHGSEVWNLAFVLTRRRDLADDVSQDVFLIAYRKIDTFRGASSLRTWLLSITRNTAINAMRAAFIRRVTLTDRLHERSHEFGPSAESEMLRRSLSNDIWEDVLRLPLKLREALVLHARYELTVREIAQLLELSEGTVKSRLSRARQRMIRLRKEANAHD
ncbi:RNA polymerase sigma factor [Cohnella rhizosphaerae]|uniref:Sigma-70 family RNA polymerase sigma factor n=1 Tax=Cohnella rhizosphaerae TaxID=1457232 RepID=A0A9X4KR29_9BACL|nr:sigma-70 family RNA polymerase sigma factor [Cohnella rhizosphaerae]MDG0808973.1 sigma-70 family RNA polymerase sigma factor [Cohnella rhizosphaerae]